MTPAKPGEWPVEDPAEQGQEIDARPCDECGAEMVLVWYAPNDLWNRIMGGPEAKFDPGGYLCPLCFERKAGEPLIWRADIPGRLEALEKELEMCQRYFPFMRRSRDEAVRKLSACREDHDRLLGAYTRDLEGCRAARDEAVKSEKRRTDELARLRGILNEEERRRSDAQEREKALRAAIERALEPLGTGDCSVNACDGCEWETKEAIRILRAALDQSGKEARRLTERWTIKVCRKCGFESLVRENPQESALGHAVHAGKDGEADVERIVVEPVPPDQSGKP